MEADGVMSRGTIRTIGLRDRAGEQRQSGVIERWQPDVGRKRRRDFKGDAFGEIVADEDLARRLG